MTNIKLSLVTGYPVEIPAPNEHVSLPSLAPRRLFKRIAEAFHRTEIRRQEAVVADFIARNGGVITDDIERQIGQRFGA